MTYEYRIGGSLNHNHPTYVERKADKDLLEALKAGEFCYVFNCRQMGKSSLRVRTIHQLQKQGFICTSIDITSLGSEVNLQKWYNGLIIQLFLGFNLGKKFNLKAWLKEREDIPPVQKLKDFLEQIIFVEFVQQKIIICFDEIDKLISLDFSSDDFFSFIRFCYNQRAENKNYEQVTFALFGVTTPSDLIREKTQTSFNIGKAIELTGFTIAEAKSLEEGLIEKVESPYLALKEILYWTGGQPFLTQKLCQYVKKYSAFIYLENQSEVITQLVNTSMTENWESQDEPVHFKTIKDRLLRNEQKAGRLLGLYQQILKHGWIEVDDSPEQTELKLSGLVVEKNNKLVVYNPIYQAIFNQEWLIKQLEKLRPYSEAINAWELSNYQDESRLLRGQSLKDALVWTVGKSLSNLDYQFLNASQKLEQKDIEINLDTERKANQILTNANQKAKQMIRVGSVILGISLVSAIGSAIATFQAIEKQQEAQLGTQLQQTSETALRQFQFQQLDALKSSIQAGQKLENIVKDQRILAKYPTTSPIISLQQILREIQEKNQLESHQEAVTSVAFSPSGNYLATASRDNTVKLWTKNGKELKTLKGHQGAIYGAAFSPDSKTIATASQDRTIILWDLQEKALVTLQGHKGSVYSVSFSPNGQFIASTSRDGTARLWNLKGQQLRIFSGHKKSVDDVSFSPDGKKLATASRDGSLIIWNLEGEKLLIIKQPNLLPFYSVSFSPDAQYIAAATSDGITKIWDLQGKLILTLKGHLENVNSVNFSPDGKSLVTASSDGTAKIWTLQGQELTTLKGHLEPVYEAVFSPDGKSLATASSDGTAKLWQLNSTIYTQDQSSEIGITSVSFSPDGAEIATANKDGYIIVKNIQSKQSTKFSSDLEWIYDLDFSSNHQKIAAASRSGIAKIWDIKGKVLTEIEIDSTPVYSVSFSPNLPEIAIGLGDGRVAIWNIQNQKPLLKKSVQVDVNPISSLAFSPDGNQLAIASREGIIQLINQDDFYIKFASNQARIYQIVYSSDGQKIATASNDGTVKIWNRQRQLITTLRGDLFPVYSVVFSNDGKFIATASSDGTARIWDESGQLRSEYKGEQNSLLGIDFTTNSQQLITISQNGKIGKWQVENELSRLSSLLNQGCQWLDDYLNSHPQEREELTVCQPKL
ncbi:AAA-like domain-containing protein [Chroococcus sp. FPU101]|uniref:AAA-like domain-containing protein n=1 Tax=Chroococcus sp. FPU101 TaxID=1974212 RepID=UPI001A8E39FB|nr:AAA-like domain-containing protein [Chroococcus sp. FPU101]GFE69914.1 WD-40 repeat protein [Chroococcus sp. FPU101]